MKERGRGNEYKKGQDENGAKHRPGTVRGTRVYGDG